MRATSAKAFALALSITCASVGSTQAAEDVLERQVQGSVAYVSGGVGSAEQEALRAVQGEYNLKLEFAEEGVGPETGQNIYLSDVAVTIFDAKDHLTLEATARGPVMLVRLAPGAYKVIAVNEGKSQSRTVTVPATSSVSTLFRWAATGQP